MTLTSVEQYMKLEKKTAVASFSVLGHESWSHQLITLKKKFFEQLIITVKDAASCGLFERSSR